MKKMDKIVEIYRSNQDAPDNLNSKLDTVLSVLNDDKFKIFQSRAWKYDDLLF